MKLAEHHREFQKSGRRVIHSIRTFLNVNYIDLIDMRKGKLEPIGLKRERTCLSELTNYRDYMDMKKYELENAKTPEMINVKNKEYEEALREYTNHLTKVRPPRCSTSAP